MAAEILSNIKSKWAEDWFLALLLTGLSFLDLLAAHCCTFEVGRCVFGIVCAKCAIVICINYTMCLFFSWFCLLTWNLRDQVRSFFAVLVFFVLHFCILSRFNNEVKVLCENGHFSVLCKNKKVVVLFMLLYKNKPFRHFLSRYCWKYWASARPWCS